ncbi:unnamed protein product [Strongylus vulgaris]|uniref:Uncharacterized protein n=1 Tax=Strongylus vulgaris TaxID=40348 RepID=A0A3P7IB99_STRVU|nr:unnamed protein product [Strongylus vulgaris]
MKRFHHGTLKALDLSYTHFSSIVSIRMRSYYLAWLSFYSVLRIRKASPSFNAILELDAFYENSEKVIRKEIYYEFVVGDSMRKSRCQKKERIGSGDLDQDSRMRALTVLFVSSAARFFHGNSIL